MSVLVIGGGVAGTTAAIRLRHHGFDVTLMERAVFPREKICGCCLGAAGVSALDAIGLGNAVRDLGVATRQFVGYLQTRRQPIHRDEPMTTRKGVVACDPPIRFSVVPGVAISRSVLDQFLIEQSASVGVDVRQPHEAQIVHSDDRCVTVRHRAIDPAGLGNRWTTTDQYEMVIVATGLTGVFQSGRSAGTRGADSRADAAPAGDRPMGRFELPWVVPPHGPLGVATHLPGDHELAKAWTIGDGDIQMICGDDGYVGLVRLACGSIDIAAALRSGRKGGTTPLEKPWLRIARLLNSHPGLFRVSDCGANDRLDRWLEHDAAWMTAPPLRRQREPARPRAVAIGDCVRYVEPLTGEGMTWAMESGLAIADLWRDIQETPSSSTQDLPMLWDRRLNSLQPKRRVLCDRITGALRSRGVRRATAWGFSGGGWLARPIVRGLARGPDFPITSTRLTRDAPDSFYAAAPADGPPDRA